MNTFIKFILIFCGVVLISFPKQVSSLTSDRQARMQDQIYQSFVSGDIPLWERTLSELERYYASNQTADVLYDLLLARYGYIAFALETDPSKARVQLDKAEAELEKLFTYPYHLSNAHAMQGALLGFRISLRPLSGIRLGPRSYRAIRNALEANPNNPVAWMERGNSLFYTPSTFGGSKQEALDAYLKAISLFEENLQPNHKWLYLNSLVGLARSYEYTGCQRFAIATYQKALRFEPEFKWVRDELLPAAQNR